MKETVNLITLCLFTAGLLFLALLWGYLLPVSYSDYKIPYYIWFTCFLISVSLIGALTVWIRNVETL